MNSLTCPTTRPMNQPKLVLRAPEAGTCTPAGMSLRVSKREMGFVVGTPFRPQVTASPLTTAPTSTSSQWARVLRWATVLVAVLAGALWHFVHLPDASNRLGALPSSSGEVVAQEIPLTHAERAVFGNAKVVKRQYELGQQRFLVEVVDSSRERHANLDPLFALRSEGWNVDNTREISIPGGTARHLDLFRQSGKTEAMVWISDSKVRHTSESRHWWQSILRRVTLGVSGPEPVLVIVQPINGQTLAWSEVFARIPALLEI